MPLPRNYSSTAKPRALVANIDAAATTFSVTRIAAGDGWPIAPAIAVLERGTSGEELVLITAAGLNADSTQANWTVVRAFNGTAAKAHPAGAKVEHVTAGADMTQFAQGTWELDSNDPLGVAASRLPHSYPRGYSRHYVTETMGYPSAWGTVETFSWGGDTVQRYTSFLDTQVWVRTAAAGANAWKPWTLSGSHVNEMMTVQLATPGMAAPGLKHAQGGAQTHPASTIIYTVPAGKHAVIKKIKVGRWGGGVHPIVHYIGATSWGHIAHMKLVQGQSEWWDTAIVLGPGEQFYVSTSGDNSVNTHIEYVEYDQAVFPVFKFFQADLTASGFRQLYNNIAEDHVITSILLRVTGGDNTVTLGQAGLGYIESDSTFKNDASYLLEPLAAVLGGQGLYLANSASGLYVFIYGYKKRV